MSLKGRLKIRVGGTLGKAGDKLKRGAGKVASRLAPVVGLFNPMLGAALSAGGDLLDDTGGKFNLGKNLKRAATTYAIGKGAKMVGGLFRGGDAANLAPTTGVASGADDAVRAAYLKAGVAPPEGLAPAAGRFRRVAQGAGRVANTLRPKNTSDAIDLLRFAGDTYTGYKEGQREDELYARDRSEFDRLAPLRAAGQAGLLAQGPTQPPIESLMAPSSSRYRRVAVGSRV